MNISLFLAQVFGIYLIVAGVSLVLKYRAWCQIADDFIENTSLMHIVGMFVFIMGLLLILSHNVWESSWRVVITILSWLVFLKGMAFFLLPHNTLTRFVRLINNKNWYIVVGTINIIFGIYLTSKGFGII